MKALAYAITAVLALTLAACAGNRSSDRSTSASSGTSGEVRQGAQNAALTAKVKSALAADVGLKTLKIDVDSTGNTVTLKGAVDSAATRQRAEDVARKVDGVATVRNELTVRSGG